MAKNIELIYTPQQMDAFFDIPVGTRFLIIRKGRRFGATKGACNACIEWCLEGDKILWGDTISGNIDRYFERYFLPELKKNKIDYYYSKQSKQLNIANGYIDFRSADRPENWEGFGYNKIILNEAGIILKNAYLYTNAVLPMMMDDPNSLLIAMGVPKGKVGKDKAEHPFYTLFKAADNKQPGYFTRKYTSWDNPFLSKQDIDDLAAEIKRMNPAMEQQEIYGEFVDGATGVLWAPDLIKHIDKLPPLKRIVVGNDPSGSKTGDEVGIVGVGIDYMGNYYVLSDRTGGYTPLEWATITVNEINALRGDAIIVERNYGGDMVKANIMNVDKNVRVIEVTASRGKEVRAEPILSLYEQGKVFHVKGLHKLENEMLTWVPGISKSPNRVDALVWAMTELSGKKQVTVY
jgi:phage terminase large subunit-like protein